MKDKIFLEMVHNSLDAKPKLIFASINAFSNPLRTELKNNIWENMADFDNKTHNKWEDAEKENNVSCLYGLPKHVFKKIQKENEDIFCQYWNIIMKYLWKKIQEENSYARNDLNKLYLLVRTCLIVDYGYFDVVNAKRLFRVENNQ